MSATLSRTALAFAVVFVAIPAVAEPMSEASFRALVQARYAEGACLTDIPAALSAVESGAPVVPPPPLRPRLRATFGHDALPTAIEIIDASCSEGNCPAKVAQRFGDVTIYEVDTVAAASRFFALHPDTADAGFDELIFFTTFLTTASGGAYYAPLHNEVSGIARTYYEKQAGARAEIYNFNPFAGSGSRGFLKGTVLMSEWHKCTAARYYGIPCDNAIPFDTSQRGILGILGQEIGHRWGSFFYFMDGNARSDELLGRDLSHWSYYADSGGSPLEGNHWVPDGARYKLVDPAGFQYSPLDQYAMGVLPAAEVPPTLLLTSVSPAPCTTDKLNSRAFQCKTNAATPPGDGTLQLTAEPRMITIDDVIAAEGERKPAFGAASRFVYLGYALLEVPALHATSSELLVLEELRRTFARSLYDGTGRRLRAISTLTRRDDLGFFDFTLDSEGWQLQGAQPTGRRPGVISLEPLSGPVWMVHDNLELHADREPFLHLRLAADPGIEGPLLLSWTDASGNTGALELPLATDGQPRTLLIPMSGRPGWSQSVSHISMRLAASVDRPNAAVHVDSFELAATALAVDTDSDFIIDSEDNCPTTMNTDQLDSSIDGSGDACSPNRLADDTGGGDIAPAGCGCGSAPIGLLALAGLAAVRRRHRQAA